MKKPAAKKKVSKATPKKSTTKGPSASTKKKPEAAPPEAKPAAKPETGPKETGDAKRKGITIVKSKQTKRPRPTKPNTKDFVFPGTPLLGGGQRRKPLIPSGPKNVTPDSTTGAAADQGKFKSPFNKRKLDKYREILVTKRAALIGDVANLEDQALKSQSGSLSNLPQHMAEQGSDLSDQSISLNIAAADRSLIKEIDDALARIAAGTFGVCERTGKPISEERLEELPWARYSIEAARELERFRK